ncbi:MAG: alpha/beta hydrolase [Aureispira sp.]|nr:alpha/beta hydrolase [Aureispira sp.]
MKKYIITSVLLVLAYAAFALNPSRTYKQRPEKYNMEYKEVKIKTNDGKAELNIWDFPCKSKKTTALVLIAHSGEGNMADYLRRVDMLRAEYNVVLFDYRGFGESSEFEIDKNMYIYPHFTDDLESMIDYCRKQHVQTFNLYGWGIGAGMALGVGYNRTEINRIIADTPFLSMEDLENRFESWDEPMEVPFAGYEKRFEPINAFDNPPAKNLTAVKFIIGSNDILYKAADLKTLQAKQKKLVGKNIYVVENPDRKDNFKINKAAYTKEVLSFLKG